MTRSAVPEDESVVQLMRSVMHERVEEMPAAPGWARVSTRLQGIRRRRRRRAVAGLGAGLVAVVAVAGVVQGQVGRRENPPAAATLVGHPVRGSLAGDKAWLESLRRRAVAEFDLIVDSEIWEPTGRDSVQVIFAGDVDGYRLALVAGGWQRTSDGSGTPSGPGSTPAGAPTFQRWFVGPAKAQVRDLVAGTVSVDSPALAVQVVEPDTLRAASTQTVRTGVAVVLSARPVDVRLAGPASYAKDGRVTLPRNEPVAQREPGVYATAVPADGGYRLLVGGRVHAGRVVSSRTQEASPPDFSRDVTTGLVYLPKVVQPLFGGSTPAREVLMTAAEVMQRHSGLRVGDSTITLLSATPHLDADGDPNEWTVLMAVTAPSGARFIGVTEVNRTGQAVGESGRELEGWTTVAAGGLDGAAMAWPTAGIDNATVSDRGLIAFLAPAGTVTAEVLGVRGQSVGTVEVTRRYGSATFGSAGLKTVRFLDADGDELGRAQVQPYSGGGSRRPLDTWPSPPG